MNAIRIAVSELPQLLSEIVINIVDSQQDMEIVATPPAATDLGRALERSGADVLVTGCECRDLADRGEALLSRHPRLKIIALDADGQRSYYFGMRPHMEPLGEASPERLVEAIREAASPSGFEPHAKEM